MKRLGGVVFAAGSLSWAVAQWVLVLLFARLGGGAEAVGQYSIVLAITTPIFVVGQFGLRIVYLSLSTRFPWSTYLAIRLLGIFASSLVLSIFLIVSQPPGMHLWIAVICLKSVDAFVDLLYARLQRDNHLARIGWFSLLNSSVTVVISIIVLGASGSMALAVAGSAVVSLVIAVLVGTLGGLQSDEREASERGYKRIVSAGLPTTVSELIAAGSNYIPILFLSVISTQAAVGVFATAAYLITFANLFGAILKNVYTSPFRHLLADRGGAALQRRADWTAFVLLLVGGATGILVVWFGAPILQAVYGPEFRLSFGELVILVISVLPIVPSCIYMVNLNVLQSFTSQTVIWILSCVVGVLAGWAAFEWAGATAMVSALWMTAGIGWGRLVGALLVSRRESAHRESANAVSRGVSFP